MTSTLTGRTAVITGGARGIGLTLARALAAAGVGVALLDLLDAVDDAAKSIADEFNVPTYAQSVDVTDQAAVADAFVPASGSTCRGCWSPRPASRSTATPSK